MMNSIFNLLHICIFLYIYIYIYIYIYVYHGMLEYVHGPNLVLVT